MVSTLDPGMQAGVNAPSHQVLLYEPTTPAVSCVQLPNCLRYNKQVLMHQTPHSTKRYLSHSQHPSTHDNLFLSMTTAKVQAHQR